MIGVIGEDDPDDVATMKRPALDLAVATEAYAAYLNAPRGVLDSEQQVLFDEDMARARAAMELAWLEATPVREGRAK